MWTIPLGRTVLKMASEGYPDYQMTVECIPGTKDTKIVGKVTAQQWLGEIIHENRYSVIRVELKPLPGVGFGRHQ